MDEEFRVIRLTGASAERVIIVGCEGCGDPESRLRQCTAQKLCSSCRRLPEFRIVPGSWVRQRVPWLPKEMWPAPAGASVNPSNPRFARVPMYSWSDVAERCEELDLTRPDFPS